MNHPPDSERAVSEIFGAMVLIGVIVTGLAIAGVMLLSQPQPQKIPDLNALFSSNAQTVQIQHNGGDSFLKSEIQIRLDGQDKTSSFAEDGNSGWTTWSVGQSLTYDVPSSSQVPSLIQIVYTGGGISQLIAASGEGSTQGLSVPAPVVNGITPNSGNVGDTVHITNLAGSYFFSGATAKLSRAGFPDISGTSVVVVSSSQITCDLSLPAYSQGIWDAVVTNPSGPSGTLTNGFTILNPSAPTFSSVTPTSGSTAGGTFVTITGTNLIGTTSATFGGSAASGLSVVNATTITATTTSHAAQNIDVVVVTPNGTATGSGAYTYVVVPPTFYSIAPLKGPIAGGTPITIIGTNLIGATNSGASLYNVSIGGTALTNMTVVSDTQIIGSTPPHAVGHVDVVITTPNGTVTGTSAYRYYQISVFTSSNTWTIPANVDYVDYLVVGGGGGGGRLGGGGGAGGVLSGTLSTSGLTSPVRVIVGGGGAGAANNAAGSSGGNSSFANTTVGNGINADGGGGGGSNVNSAVANGLLGGSGGGGAVRSNAGHTIGTVGSGIPGQGNVGGLGAYSSRYYGGGGGGAGGTGGTLSGSTAGSGGIGSSAFSALLIEAGNYGVDVGGIHYIAGGGGGGAANGGTAGGAGGSGGGGAGALAGAAVNAGTVNTGGGGGASGATGTTGGAGGSGIVIIEYY